MLLPWPALPILDDSLFLRQMLQGLLAAFDVVLGNPSLLLQPVKQGPRLYAPAQGRERLPDGLRGGVWRPSHPSLAALTW